MMVVLLFLISVMLIGMASGDGMTVRFAGDGVTVEPGEEKDQLAVIHHADGMEWMLVSITAGHEETTNRSAWILPIPANATDVAVNITTFFPVISGKDIVDGARTKVRATGLYAPLMAVGWPIALTLGDHLYIDDGSRDDGNGRGNEALSAGGVASISGDGVDVVAHIEAHGLVTEVVGADSGVALRDYLLSHSLDVANGSIPMLDTLVDEGQTFVVTWMDGSSGDVNPALLIRFPSEEAYFPMRLTSVYGETHVPLTVYMTGEWKVGGGTASRLEAEVSATYYDPNYSTMTWWENLSAPDDMSHGDARDLGVKIDLASHHTPVTTEEKAVHQMILNIRYFWDHSVMTEFKVDSPASRYTSDLFFERTDDPELARYLEIKENYDPVPVAGYFRLFVFPFIGFFTAFLLLRGTSGESWLYSTEAERMEKRDPILRYSVASALATLLNPLLGMFIMAFAIFRAKGHHYSDPAPPTHELVFTAGGFSIGVLYFYLLVILSWISLPSALIALFVPFTIPAFFLLTDHEKGPELYPFFTGFVTGLLITATVLGSMMLLDSNIGFLLVIPAAAVIGWWLQRMWAGHRFQPVVRRALAAVVLTPVIGLLALELGVLVAMAVVG